MPNSIALTRRNALAGLGMLTVGVAAPSSAKEQSRSSSGKVDASSVRSAATNRIDADNIVRGYASDNASQSNGPIYQTVQGLTALMIPAEIDAVRLNGYSSAGDGGGWYAVEVANSGKLMPWQRYSNSGSRRWEMVATVVDPKMFGMIGDRIADDTQSIVDSIEYLKEKCGGVLRFSQLPVGALVQNVNFTTGGYNNITIDGNFQVLYQKDPADISRGNRAPICLYNSHDVIVKNLCVDGRYTELKGDGTRQANHGIGFRATEGNIIYNIEIANCVFKNLGYPQSSFDKAGDGIFITGEVRNVNIHHNMFIDCHRWAVSFQHAVGEPINIHVDDNVSVATVANEGLGFSDFEFGAKASTARGCTVRRNKAGFNAYMAFSGAAYSDLEISDNVLSGAALDGTFKDASLGHNYGLGIYVVPAKGKPECEDVRILRNVLKGVNKGNIHLSGGNRRTRIVGNSIVGAPTSGASPTRGILLEQAVDFEVNDNQISIDVSSASLVGIEVEALGPGSVSRNTTITSSAVQSGLVVVNPFDGQPVQVRDNCIDNNSETNVFVVGGNIVFTGNFGICGKSGRSTGLRFAGPNQLGINAAIGEWTGYPGSLLYPNHANKILKMAALPSTGTWERNDEIAVPFTAGSVAKYGCTTAGTFGELSGAKADTEAGSSTIRVNTVDGLMVGIYIKIAGVADSKKIVGISGTNVMLNSIVRVRIVAGRVTYSPPVFKAMSALAL